MPRRSGSSTPAGSIAGARDRAAGICAVAPFRQPLRVLELL